MSNDNNGGNGGVNRAGAGGGGGGAAREYISLSNKKYHSADDPVGFSEENSLYMEEDDELDEDELEAYSELYQAQLNVHEEAVNKAKNSNKVNVPAVNTNLNHPAAPKISPRDYNDNNSKQTAASNSRPPISSNHVSSPAPSLNAYNQPKTPSYYNLQDPPTPVGRLGNNRFIYLFIY